MAYTVGGRGRATRDPINKEKGSSSAKAPCRAPEKKKREEINPLKRQPFSYYSLVV